MAKDSKKKPKPKANEPNSSTGGRPKKPTRQLRTNTLRIRLTEDERDELDAAAEDETLEVSSWARSVLLKEARRLAEESQ